MATLYYMIIEGRQTGPFPAEALKAQGLMPDTYVWREGLQNWVTASQLPELDYLFRENPPMESLSPSSPPSGSYYDRQPGTVPPDPYRDDSRYGEPVPHTNWLPWAVVATVAAFLLSCIGMISVLSESCRPIRPTPPISAATSLSAIRPTPPRG